MYEGKVDANMDTRSQLTIKHIDTCFLKILKEKPLTKITVTEICQLAQINRGTYYKYYTDPLNQFDVLESTFLEGYRSILEDSKVRAVEGKDPIPVSIAMTNHYRNNRDLALILLGPEYRKVYTEKYMKLYGDKLFEIWSLLNYTPSTQVRPYITQYTEFIFSLNYQWLAYDMEKISIYDFCSIVDTFSFWE